jgi:alpha-beta hydrolase superfamily lysophospholipase
MEAIYEFDVQDMPVTVAVDSQGTSVHETGPAEWQACPTLLLYTPGDRLISPKACEAFVARLPKSLITVKAFPSLAHDLLREPGREQVYKAVRLWLTRTFPALP